MSKSRTFKPFEISLYCTLCLLKVRFSRVQEVSHRMINHDGVDIHKIIIIVANYLLVNWLFLSQSCMLNVQN